MSRSKSTSLASPALAMSQQKYGTMSRLRRHRLSLGLSIRDVVTGVEPQMNVNSLSMIEAGLIVPKDKTIARLAEFYGVSGKQIRDWLPEPVERFP